MSTALRRTLLRRERYRSRSAAVSVALVITALGAAYLGTEAVLAALGSGPLLVAPTALLAALSAPEESVRGWLLGGAALVAVLGVVAIVLAVTPGRRSRHQLADDRVALLVDDDVLAGALSRGSAVTAAVPRTQVTTTVSPRRARVQVRPSSGFAVSDAAVRSTAEALVASLAPRPAVRVAVSVAADGVVGS